MWIMCLSCKRNDNSDAPSKAPQSAFAEIIGLVPSRFSSKPTQSAHTQDTAYNVLCHCLFWQCADSCFIYRYFLPNYKHTYILYTPCSTSQLEMRCSICVFCNKGSCLSNLDCTRWRSVAVNFSYLNIEEATMLRALKLSRTSRFWSTTTDTNYKSSFHYKMATGT